VNKPNSIVYNEDCIEGMKRYPDKHFDLAIVDPPYGIEMADWDKKEDIPDEEFFKELFRVSKNQLIFGGNYFTLPHTQSWVCWDKTFSDDIKGGKMTTGGCPRENMSDFELIWTSFKHKSNFLRFTQIGNLIGFGKNIKVDYDHQSKIHPTQKHYKVYKWLLKTYATEGDKILDTHLGSGSSRIAAYEMGFDFTAFEIDKDYYDAQEKRFQNFIKQLTLFPH
jgi:site-specific DNA-methyltransferase (adenine-specific)